MCPPMWSESRTSMTVTRVDWLGFLSKAARVVGCSWVSEEMVIGASLAIVEVCDLWQLLFRYTR